MDNPVKKMELMINVVRNTNAQWVVLMLQRLQKRNLKKN